jgi:hypothetical protein
MNEIDAMPKVGARHLRMKRHIHTIYSIPPSHAVNIVLTGTGALTATGTVFDDAIYTADDPSHLGALAINGLAGTLEINLAA